MAHDLEPQGSSRRYALSANNLGLTSETSSRWKNNHPEYVLLERGLRYKLFRVFVFPKHAVALAAFFYFFQPLKFGFGSVIFVEGIAAADQAIARRSSAIAEGPADHFLLDLA